MIRRVHPIRGTLRIPLDPSSSPFPFVRPRVRVLLDPEESFPAVLGARYALGILARIFTHLYIPSVNHASMKTYRRRTFVGRYFWGIRDSAGGRGLPVIIFST